MRNTHDVLFRTLADPTRRALLGRLCREGPGATSVTSPEKLKTTRRGVLGTGAIAIFGLPLELTACALSGSVEPQSGSRDELLWRPEQGDVLLSRAIFPSNGVITPFETVVDFPLLTDTEVHLAYAVVIAILKGPNDGDVILVVDRAPWIIANQADYWFRRGRNFGINLEQELWYKLRLSTKHNLSDQPLPHQGHVTHPWSRPSQPLPYQIYVTPLSKNSTKASLALEEAVKDYGTSLVQLYQTGTD
jgi:hypothetical protein